MRFLSLACIAEDYSGAYTIDYTAGGCSPAEIPDAAGFTALPISDDEAVSSITKLTRLANAYSKRAVSFRTTRPFLVNSSGEAIIRRCSFSRALPVFTAPPSRQPHRWRVSPKLTLVEGYVLARQARA